MIQEKWLRWIPNDNFSGNYSIKDCVYSKANIKINLIDDNGFEIIIHFCSVIAFKITEEICEVSLPGILLDAYGANFFVGWSFFQIKNSLYIQELIEGSPYEHLANDFIHFVIYNDDFKVDIITSIQPSIEQLEVENNG